MSDSSCKLWDKVDKYHIEVQWLEYSGEWCAVSKALSSAKPLVMHAATSRKAVLELVKRLEKGK